MQHTSNNHTTNSNKPTTAQIANKIKVDKRKRKLTGEKRKREKEQ